MTCGKLRGFTLVEMVVALVIMSIISIGLVQFISDAASGYQTSASRNQLSSAGRVLVDRIAMELHNALPQSVRISTVKTFADAYGEAGDQCIEFIPVEAATTYINPAFRPASFKSVFNVVNLVPGQVGETGLYAVVYPVAASDIYNASWVGNTTGAIVGLSAVADSNSLDGIQELTTANPHRFKRRSPTERLFVVRQPVSFCISGARMYRYNNYGFTPVQRIPQGPLGACASVCLPASTPQRTLITDQLDNTALIGGAAGQGFDYMAATRRRNGVVQLEFNFSQSGDSVRLNHEVLQQIVP